MNNRLFTVEDPKKFAIDDANLIIDGGKPLIDIIDFIKSKVYETVTEYQPLMKKL